MQNRYGPERDTQHEVQNHNAKFHENPLRSPGGDTR